MRRRAQQSSWLSFRKIRRIKLACSGLNSSNANTASYGKAAEPVLKALGAIGFPVGAVGELRHGRRNYRAAVPTLLEWLFQISDRQVKEDLIRPLSVRFIAEPRRAANATLAHELQV